MSCPHRHSQGSSPLILPSQPHPGADPEFHTVLWPACMYLPNLDTATCLLSQSTCYGNPQGSCAGRAVTTLPWAVRTLARVISRHSVRDQCVTGSHACLPHQTHQAPAQEQGPMGAGAGHSLPPDCQAQPGEPGRVCRPSQPKSGPVPRLCSWRSRSPWTLPWQGSSHALLLGHSFGPRFFLARAGSSCIPRDPPEGESASLQVGQGFPLLW